ncbi:MAG: Rv3235 family protein, partial [Pseudonocardiaceae bacterium]
PTPRPSSRELAAWLTALIEVAAGRRSQARVSQLLSERLSTEIRSAAVAELGCTYAFTRVHHCEPAPRLLEVCATAHDRRHGRALAVVARLEAGWTGWRFTRFAVIGPTRRGGSGRVSAA